MAFRCDSYYSAQTSADNSIRIAQERVDRGHADKAVARRDQRDLADARRDKARALERHLRSCRLCQ